MVYPFTVLILSYYSVISFSTLILCRNKSTEPLDYLLYSSDRSLQLRCVTTHSMKFVSCTRRIRLDELSLGEQKQMRNLVF